MNEESKFKSVNHQLAEISRIMADGYVFCHMRGYAEEWEKKAVLGDPAAIRLLEMITHFGALCHFVERNIQNGKGDTDG